LHATTFIKEFHDDNHDNDDDEVVVVVVVVAEEEDEKSDLYRNALQNKKNHRIATPSADKCGFNLFLGKY